MNKLPVVLCVALLLAGCGDESGIMEEKPTSRQTAAEEEAQKWVEWEAAPKPYGGPEVLAKIRHAKESGATSLNLPNNRITNLSPLEGLTNLGKLSLHGNLITDVTPLAGLTKLAHLKLYGNEIADITPLQSLPNLIVLSLNKNRISDVSPLVALTNLMLLGLDDNPIPDAQKAMLREALPNCEIIFQLK